MDARMATVIDSDIWSRVLRASWSDLPVAEAEGILRLGFGPRDLKRIEKLGILAQEGEISAPDRTELEEYLRVSHILMLMKSQARQVLRRRGGKPAPSGLPNAPRRRRAS
jgi:hypothetical protein